MAGHSPLGTGHTRIGRESRGYLAWCVYILRCSDGSYYVGHAEDVAARVKRHQDGNGAAWTAARRPVSLVFEEELPSEKPPQSPASVSSTDGPATRRMH